MQSFLACSSLFDWASMWTGFMIYVSDGWFVHAVNTTDGTDIWLYTVPNWINLATAPIVMADDGVVFGTWDNVLIRLWPNGTQRWITQKFDGGGGTFGYDQPAVDENGVIYHVTYSFAVVAVHPLTGAVLWRTELGYQTTSYVALVRTTRCWR